MAIKSFFGGITVEPTKEKVKRISKKIAKPKQISTEAKLRSKTVTDEEKVKIVSEEVKKILGVYEKDTVVIDNIDSFRKYIDEAIKNGIIAVDTETNNSLDPITCKIMGLCLYTPGQKNAYIPVNHTTLDGIRLDWQITEQDIFNELSRLSNTKILMHNAKFDYKVLKCTCGIELNCYWDTIIAAGLLDENESVALKFQYRTRLDPTIDKYDIEGLFKGLPYAIFDPKIFALYAATDAYMTYKLYLHQLDLFSKKGMDNLFHLFQEVEMPIVFVVAEMELNGVSIDRNYISVLSKKYNDKLKEAESTLEKSLNELIPIIDKWRLKKESNLHYPKKKGRKPVSDEDFKNMTKEEQDLYITKTPNQQLSNPPELTSPLQLSILLYDILGCPQVKDKKTGLLSRSTGEEDLKRIGLPICNDILNIRELNKLINTYIDKLPECANPKTDRIHANFNQLGAATGRFASKDPNLQNIPSHNNEIRMLFVPREGNVMIGSDFS